MADTTATVLTTSNFRAFQLADEIVRGPDSLSITVPNVTGEGTLFLELSDARPRPCGDHCTIRSVSQAAYHAVTIAP